VSRESTTPDLEEDAHRRGIAAVGRRDFDEAPTVLTPDAVFDMSPMGGGVFEGRDAVRGLLEDWVAAYEDYEHVIEELRVLRNGVTYAILHQRGRLMGSSGFVELRYAAVAIWRDGLIERFTVYATDIDEARAAAERLAQERG
jgi:ketosteroid isomerase-like protein